MKTKVSTGPVSAGLHDGVDKVANAAANVAGETAREAGQQIQRASQSAHGMIDQVTGVATSTAGWLNKKAEAAQAAPQKIADSGRKYIRANPWKSLGVVAVLGVIVGRALL